jgi:hypothetical protein
VNERQVEDIIHEALVEHDQPEPDSVLVHWVLVGAWANAADKTDYRIMFAGGQMPHYMALGLLEMGRRLLNDDDDD